MNNLISKLRLAARYYTSTGVSYVIELSLLLWLSTVIGWPYYFAVPTASITSATVNFVGCHMWVFASSGRKLKIEYSYFMAILASGVLLTVVIVTLIELIYPMEAIYARLISGLVTGLTNFYLNARYNFHARAFMQ